MEILDEAALALATLDDAAAGPYLWLCALVQPARWRTRYNVWQGNRLIWNQLDRTIPFRYPKGIRLDEFSARLRDVTKGEELATGLPIYFDPQGLQDAGCNLSSIVTIDVQDRPLREALKRALEPMGLAYRVADGILVVSEKTRSCRDDRGQPLERPSLRNRANLRFPGRSGDDILTIWSRPRFFNAVRIGEVSGVAGSRIRLLQEA
jgi:hypothetical protein